MYVYVVVLVEREIFLVDFVRIKAACMYYKASISISKHNYQYSINFNNKTHVSRLTCCDLRQ